ncbi:MAG: hypothetical protein WBD07_12395 [Vicinamibacterales bacterium]
MKKTVMILAIMATTSIAAQTQNRVSTWWLLMNEASSSTTASSAAKVMGPYASQEVCRLVARQQLPNDRRFWTAEERRVAETADQIARQQRAAARLADIANRQAAIKAFHQLYPKGGVLLYKGERIRILADGTEYFPLTEFSTDFGEAPGDSSLSGCVEVKPE